jgi:hypothetical protein
VDVLLFYACENVKVVIWWYSSSLRSSVEGKWG